MPYALLFPGQGSQQVGMGADFRRRAASAEVLERADAAAGLPISATAAVGPPERLTDTRFAQPAVVATSLAAYAALREELSPELPPPAFHAGHSVGELAALAAAGALTVADALRLVARRAALMAAVCAEVDGGMAAVLAIEPDVLRALCDEAGRATGQRVEIANLNAPGQLVVAGHRAAIAWLQNEAPARGARRVIPLNVAGPFHSDYMRPAADAFAAELATVPLATPAVPVVLNQTARPSCDPAEIRRELAAQVAAPVRWAESLRAMAEAGCTLFVELGPGQVLTGLVRRTLPSAHAVSVQDETGLAAALRALAELGDGDEHAR